MSDAGDQADDEVDETPGVEEWIAVESEAADALDRTPPED